MADHVSREGPHWYRWEKDTEHPDDRERLDVGGSGAPNRYYLTGMLAPQAEADPTQKKSHPNKQAGQVRPLKEEAPEVKTTTPMKRASLKRAPGARRGPWASRFALLR